MHSFVHSCILLKSETKSYFLSNINREYCINYLRCLNQFMKIDTVIFDSGVKIWADYSFPLLETGGTLRFTYPVASTSNNKNIKISEVLHPYLCSYISTINI